MRGALFASLRQDRPARFLPQARSRRVHRPKPHREPGVSMASLDVALAYLGLGWSPIPVHPKSKKPVSKEWPSLRLTASSATELFQQPDLNVGVLLGEPSDGLVDIDLDCPEAVRLARHFLPATVCFGRASKVSSHWLYR